MVSNHQICDECYLVERDRLNLPFKEPVRLPADGPLSRLFDACCWCGRWNNSRIYIRSDPGRMACNHWVEVMG